MIGCVKPPRRRGIMLLIVLWIVAILSLLAYSVIYQAALETRLTSVRKRTVQAKAAARAGLAKGMVDLQNDLINDLSEEFEIYDSEGDYWALGQDEDERIDVELAGGATYTIETVDENRFFNLNAMTAANRVLLEEIIEKIGYEEEDAKIVASAIIDYADGDEDPSLDSSSGDEGTAYAMIQADNEGRRVREDDVEPMIFPNEAYRGVDQLLDVYGVTPELYFGPESEEAEYFRRQMKLGEVARRGEAFLIRDTRRRRGEEVLGLRDFFTVTDVRELNINTAPQHVLEVYFKAGGRSDGDRLAETVIKQRRGGKSRRIDREDAFKSEDEVAANGDLGSILGALESIYPLGVISSHFTLTSTGRVGEVRQVLRVTVLRRMFELQRDETFESRDRSREQQEGYDQRSRRRQDSDDELTVRNPGIYIVKWHPT